MAAASEREPDVRPDVALAPASAWSAMRCRSVPVLRTSLWAAAISIARGSPSSVRTIAAMSRSRSSVTAKSARSARARSQNMRTPGFCASSAGGTDPSAGTGSGAQLVDGLAVHAQRPPARDQHMQARGHGAYGVHDRPDAGDDVLAGVQHEQPVARAQRVGEARQGVRCPRRAEAEGVGDGPGDVLVPRHAAQVDPPHGTSEPGGQGGREAGLAHPGRAGEGVDGCDLHRGGRRGQVGLAADHRQRRLDDRVGRGRPQGPWEPRWIGDGSGPTSSRGATQSSDGSWRRIATSRSRISAPGSRPSSRASTWRTPRWTSRASPWRPVPVERDRELRVQPLAQRVGGRQRLRLQHHLAVPAEGEHRVEPRLLRLQVGLLQAGPLGRGPGEVGRLGVGLAAPQADGLVGLGEAPADLGADRRRRPGRRGADQQLEPSGVDGLVRDVEAVAGRRGAEDVPARRPQRAPEVRHQLVDGVVPVAGRVELPEALREDLDGLTGAPVQQEGVDQGPGTSAAERDGGTVDADLEGPQHPELDRGLHGTTLRDRPTPARGDDRSPAPPRDWAATRLPRVSTSPSSWRRESVSPAARSPMTVATTGESRPR